MLTQAPALACRESARSAVELIQGCYYYFWAWCLLEGGLWNACKSSIDHAGARGYAEWEKCGEPKHGFCNICVLFQKETPVPTAGKMEFCKDQAVPGFKMQLGFIPLVDTASFFVHIYVLTGFLCRPCLCQNVNELPHTCVHHWCFQSQGSCETQPPDSLWQDIWSAVGAWLTDFTRLPKPKCYCPRCSLVPCSFSFSLALFFSQPVAISEANLCLGVSLQLEIVTQVSTNKSLCLTRTMTT